MLLLRGRQVESAARADQVAPAALAAGVAAVIPGWAVVSAGLTPVVLTAGWLVAGLVQPVSYSPMRQTVSVMAGHSGHDRWIMEGVLLAVGGCYLVTAAGLACLDRPARTLLVVAGVCSVGIAASPVSPGGPTATHLAWTVLGALTIAVWPAVACRGGPVTPALISERGSLLASALFLAMLGWVLVETQSGDMLGLAERLATSTASTWPFVVALLRRRAAAESGDRADQPDRTRLSA
ncbi:MAG TPA: DUF998 domain-containing protein [Streptosporangiaceae bacterium]|nr:DUF998 domain-containing protein [Streptosporangiaceae bacterium]